MRAAGAGGVIKGRAARTVAGEKAMAKLAKRGAGATVKTGKPLGGMQSTAKGRSMASRSGTMKPPMTTAGMIKQGGNRWQKGGMDRVYFNNLGSRGGLKIDQYKSGNISSASLKGKAISNSKAGEISAVLASSKLYYDRKDRKMKSQVPTEVVGSKGWVRGAQAQTAAGIVRQVSRSIKKAGRIPVKRQRKTRAS
jgi:hypothetical protein